MNELSKIIYILLILTNNDIYCKCCCCKCDKNNINISENENDDNNNNNNAENNNKKSDKNDDFKKKFEIEKIEIDEKWLKDYKICDEKCFLE